MSAFLIFREITCKLDVNPPVRPEEIPAEKKVAWRIDEQGEPAKRGQTFCNVEICPIRKDLREADAGDDGKPDGLDFPL
jgi:hypothetical protein